MLDSDICIYALRGRHPHVAAKLRSMPMGGLCMSSVTLAELLYGAEKSVRRDHNLEVIRKFTSHLEIASWGDSAAEIFAAEKARLEREGTPLATPDLMIGAHAMAIGAVMVTNNVRHFDRIRGLQIENWAATAAH